MTEEYKNILTEWMNQTGETVYAIAKATGLSQTVLGNWLKGKHTPDKDKWALIVKHFSKENSKPLSEPQQPYYKTHQDCMDRIKELENELLKKEGVIEALSNELDKFRSSFMEASDRGRKRGVQKKRAV